MALAASLTETFGSGSNSITNNLYEGSVTNTVTLGLNPLGAAGSPIDGNDTVTIRSSAMEMMALTRLMLRPGSGDDTVTYLRVTRQHGRRPTRTGMTMFSSTYSGANTVLDGGSDNLSNTKNAPVRTLAKRRYAGGPGVRRSRMGPIWCWRPSRTSRILSSPRR